MSIIPVCNALRSPATLIDNVYMSETSLVQSAARVLNKETYRYPFNSLQLSSTNTLVIQKNLMVSHVLVVAEFNPSGIVPGWFLDEGWGFELGRRLQLQYGGSEVIEIDYHDNFLRAINECENDRKKTAMIQNAGKTCWYDGTTYHGSVISNSLGTPVYRAVFPLLLPHSSVSSFRQLSLDVSCLNQSVNIRLSLADVSSLWKWIGPYTSAQPAYTANQLTLSFGEFVVGQSILIDTIASKKDLVSGYGPSSSYQLNYFFKYCQHFESAFQYGTLVQNDALITSTTTTGGAINVVLNSFRNGALDSIVLWVERLGPFNAYRSAAQAAVLPAATGLNTIPMSNITLNYAGTQIYRSESAELSQALDYMINATDSTYNYTPTVLSGAQPNAGTPTRQNYVRIQIAQFSETLYSGSACGGMIQACGGLLSNDTLQLSFDITDYLGIATTPPVGFPTTPSYRLNMQMVYQSSLVIERGSARFGFVNPMGQPQIPFNMS